MLFVVGFFELDFFDGTIECGEFGVEGSDDVFAIGGPFASDRDVHAEVCNFDDGVKEGVAIFFGDSVVGDVGELLDDGDVSFLIILGGNFGGCEDDGRFGGCEFAEDEVGVFRFECDEGLFSELLELFFGK